MGRYLVKRLVFLVWILLSVMFLAFLILHLLPGDPAQAILQTGWTPQLGAALDKSLGLDKPLWQQYLSYVWNMAHLNFGTDWISGQPISQTLSQCLPPTIEMVLLSQLLALVLAIPLATLAALRPSGIFDRLANMGSFGLLSVPTYVVITLLYIPISEWLGVPNSGPASYVPFTQDWLANIESLSIPIIALSIGSFVVYFRVFRADLITSLQDEFITMARSKGISKSRILFRHAYRPSSVALLSAIGVNMAGLITGTFIAESVFQINGVGGQLLQATQQPDYQLIQAIVFVTATLIILINFAIDLLTGYIDPRISRD